MSSKAHRLEAIEANLTGIERKVLEAVPFAEDWDSTQISNWLITSKTSTAPLRVVIAALHELKDKGLIRLIDHRTNGRPTFRRIPAKAKDAAPKGESVPITTSVTKLPAPAAAPDPMAELERISNVLLQQAQDLSSLAATMRKKNNLSAEDLEKKAEALKAAFLAEARSQK